MSKNILIIGDKGQIGTAIKQIEQEAGNTVHGIDLDTSAEMSKDKPLDVLHICIPFNDKDSFIQIVLNHIKNYSPHLTIIHSTVQVETTNTIKDMIKTHVVHSPCMGLHPDLKDSIQTFIKIIGGDKEASELCQKHYSDIGIKYLAYSGSKESELAKLASTTYYAHCIEFMKSLYHTCKDLDVNFDEVYTRTNEIYNDGYERMDIRHVQRPILK